GVQGFVSPEARLFETAEGHGDVVGVVTVHIHHAGAQRAGDAMSGGDIARPDCGGEAVDHVVGDLDRLIHGFECHCRQYRTEDFLARDLHIGLYGIEHGGFHEITAALFTHPLAAHAYIRAVALAGIDIAEHAFHLTFVDDGTEFGCRIEWVTGLHSAANGLHF